MGLLRQITIGRGCRITEKEQPVLLAGQFFHYTDHQEARKINKGFEIVLKLQGNV